MAWELPTEFKDLLIPSLVAYTHEKADERTCLQREIAMELLRDQRFQDEDFDEEDFDGWDCMPLLEEVASRVDTMTNGGWAFVIDNGGWTTVPVCSEEQAQEWWG